MPRSNGRFMALIGAGLLMLSPASLDLAPISAPPALADDDGGGGGGGRAGRSRGGAVGGRLATPRRHKVSCGFGLPFFRCKARASRAGQRAPRARPRPTAALVVSAPDELIATGLTEQNLASLTTSGFAVMDRRQLAFPPRTLVRLRIPRGERIEDARGRVAALNAAAIVDFNHFYRPQESACESRNCGSLALVSWPAGRALSCATLPAIGMIDTGINLEHSSLRGQDVELLLLDQGRPSSDQQHGTAIATLLVGADDATVPGLLPDARLIAVDSFEAAGGSDTRMAAFDLVRAVDLLLGREIAVLNMSFTGPANALLAEAVKQALGRDISLVAAAGNSGPRAAPLYPAAYEGVIAVTALDQGMTVYRRAVRGDHIDFAAPGVNLWTAASIRGWRKKSGTSYAAPFVTAAATLMAAGDARLRGAKIAEAMSRSVKDLGTPGRDPVYGWGLIQASSTCPS